MRAFDRLWNAAAGEIIRVGTEAYIASLFGRQLRTTTALTPVKFTQGKGSVKNLKPQAKGFRGNEKGKAF